MACVLSNPLFVKCLKAISVASVFFGANTSIGNGPNFMVKGIAGQQNTHTPGFVGYICKFTLPFMVPMLLVVWHVFFRHQARGICSRPPGHGGAGSACARIG